MDNRTNKLINEAYKYIEAKELFNNLTKTDILSLYTQLDYIYNCMESVGIVDVYSKFEILKEFDVVKGFGSGCIYLRVDSKKGYQLKEINPIEVIKELHKVFTKR